MEGKGESEAQERKTKAPSNRVIPSKHANQNRAETTQQGLSRQVGQAAAGVAHSPTPAALPAGSTDPKQTETRDFGFLWIDVFVCLWHNFFEVGWFYSEEGPKLSYPGDWLLKSLFSPSAPARPDSSSGPPSTSLTLSPEPFFPGYLCSFLRFGSL